MRLTHTRIALVAGLLAAAAIAESVAASPEPAAAVDAAQPQEATQVDLPMTVDELWYRAGGKKRSGYLIVSKDGLEFVARKKTFQIPIDRVRFVDFGTMRGDVDTEWAVLSVGVKAPYDVVGIRDGKRWGFGRRTRTIHANLLRAMRSLGAAQYAASAGHQAFQTQDLKCAFEIPEAWHVLVESAGVGRLASGEILFSADRIRTVERAESGGARSIDDYELLDAVNAGERAGFRVRQSVSGRGMSCEGFSGSERERLTQEFLQQVVGDGLEPVGEVQPTRASVGDCEALRWSGRALDAKGREVTVEMHAVASNGRLYMLTLRELDDTVGGRAPYENAVRSLKLGAALPD